MHPTVATFPKVGFGELRLQLTSSADSIASCIAEGSAASTQREFARYLDMAIRSTSETEHHLICAHDRRAIGRSRHNALSEEVVEMRRMLIALRQRVIAAAEEEQKKLRLSRRRPAKPPSPSTNENADPPISPP